MKTNRLATFLLLLLALPAVTAAQDKVRILIWEEFLSPKVIKILKNRHDILVETVTFTSPEEREKLLAEQRPRLDIVVADSVWMAEYRRRGWLEKIDTSKVPNARQVLARWRTDAAYTVPYLWGHTGIAWRTDKVDQPITSYAQLFALATKNPGKVSLLDDANEALRAALYARGKSPWRMNTPDTVQAANALLQKELKKFRVVGSELDEHSPWLDGKLIAGQAFNGDIAYLRDTYKAPLAFAIPSPGCMVWQEQLLLLNTAPAKAAAYRFLNLVNEPSLAARNAMDVRYATANVLAAEQLDPAFRSDPIIRPTFDGLDGCYFYQAFDKPTQEAIDKVKLR